jgi:hypothetical protein
MRIRYTTYDVRQADDVIRIKAEPNVIVLQDPRLHAPLDSDEPPYRYARVLGIYHADVRFLGSLPDGSRDYTPHRINFLWVRWYASCGYPPSTVWEMERLRFLPLNGQDAFGFIDPKHVLRAAHLIPQFSEGKQASIVPASPWLGIGPCYNFYYVNRYCDALFKFQPAFADTDFPPLRFADRDMFMRFHWKLGIGYRTVQRRYKARLHVSDTTVGSRYAAVETFPAFRFSEIEESDSSESESSSDSSEGSSSEGED